MARHQAVLSTIALCVVFDLAHAFSVSPAFAGMGTRGMMASSLRNLARGSPISVSMTISTSRPTEAETKEKAKEAAVPSSDWRIDLPEPLIESDCGADYIPLLTALKLGRYEEADQLTRELLIWIGGEGPRKRGFVYFAEAPKLPAKDIATIDRLWLAYSKGKFGYSVQKNIWNSKSVTGDFPRFVATIDWTTGPCGGCTTICSGCPGTLKRWTPEGQPGNQYVYDLDKAKKGHLPLTSALRGTYLLRSLLSHPVFGSEPVLGAPTVTAESSKVKKTGAAAVNEPLFTMAQLRFGDSPYSSRKNPWDV